MGKVDNDKMWAFLLKDSTDQDLVESITFGLKEQGLEYNGKDIVKMREEKTPQTFEDIIKLGGVDMSRPLELKVPKEDLSKMTGKELSDEFMKAFRDGEKPIEKLASEMNRKAGLTAIDSISQHLLDSVDGMVDDIVRQEFEGGVLLFLITTLLSGKTFKQVLENYTLVTEDDFSHQYKKQGSYLHIDKVPETDYEENMKIVERQEPIVINDELYNEYVNKVVNYLNKRLQPQQK